MAKLRKEHFGFLIVSTHLIPYRSTSKTNKEWLVAYLFLLERISKLKEKVFLFLSLVLRRTNSVYMIGHRYTLRSIVHLPICLNIERKTKRSTYEPNARWCATPPGAHDSIIQCCAVRMDQTSDDVWRAGKTSDDVCRAWIKHSVACVIGLSEGFYDFLMFVGKPKNISHGPRRTVTCLSVFTSVSRHIGQETQCIDIPSCSVSYCSKYFVLCCLVAQWLLTTIYVYMRIDELLLFSCFYLRASVVALKCTNAPHSAATTKKIWNKFFFMQSSLC